MQRHPTPALKAAHVCKAAHASKAGLTHCIVPLLAMYNMPCENIYHHHHHVTH
jgi:hypothetical protein